LDKNPTTLSFHMRWILHTCQVSCMGHLGSISC